MNVVRWLARGLLALLGDLGLLGLAILRWIVTIAATLVGVALAAFANAALVDAAAPAAGRMARLVDAREALVAEAWYVGGATAFLSMLAIGLLIRLGVRGAWPILGSTLGACVTVASILFLADDMHVGSASWPAFLAPLPAALTGLGAWKLLDTVFHHVGLGADIATDLADVADV